MKPKYTIGQKVRVTYSPKYKNLRPQWLDWMDCLKGKVSTIRVVSSYLGSRQLPLYYIEGESVVLREDWLLPVDIEHPWKWEE